MIKLDFKFMKLPLFIYITTVIAFFVILAVYPEFFGAKEQFNGVYESNMFYFTDFLFPFLSLACVIMQLGGTFEPKTHEFFRSLPVKVPPVVRWLRTAGFAVIVNFMCVGLAYFILGGENGFADTISLARMCYIGQANMLLFLSLALIIIMLVKQIFYAFCILYGYLLTDLVVGSDLLGDKSVFINIFAMNASDVVDINRCVLYCISAACIVAAVAVQNGDLIKGKFRDLRQRL